MVKKIKQVICKWFGHLSPYTIGEEFICERCGLRLPAITWNTPKTPTYKPAKAEHG